MRKCIECNKRYEGVRPQRIPICPKCEAFNKSGTRPGESRTVFERQAAPKKTGAKLSKTEALRLDREQMALNHALDERLAGAPDVGRSLRKDDPQRFALLATMYIAREVRGSSRTRMVY